MGDARHLVAFIVAGLLLNLTPGPDVLYIVARSTSQGRWAGILSALGVGAGCLVHIAAAALGLSALLLELPAAYQVVRWGGALYLVWLGVRAWRQPGGIAELGALSPQPLRRVFLQGLLTNVLNPKVALFFIAFLPQFTDPARGGLGLQFVGLGLIFDFNATLVNVAYALLASRLGDWMRARLGASRLLNRLTGGLFVGLGVRLMFAERR